MTAKHIQHSISNKRQRKEYSRTLRWVSQLYNQQYYEALYSYCSVAIKTFGLIIVHRIFFVPLWEIKQHRIRVMF